MQKTNARVETYKTMCERVEQCLAAKPEILKSGSLLLELYEGLSSRITELNELEVGRKQLEKHPAQQKRADKEKLDGYRQLFADALLGFATRTNNIELRVRAREFGRKINFRRDTDLKLNFLTLMADVKANAESLVPYYVTADDITQAEALQSKLAEMLNQTTVAISQRAAKTRSRDEIVQELRAFFRNQLDPAVRSLKDPDFTAYYASLRRVRNMPSSHTGDDFESQNSPETVAPEQKNAVAAPEIKMDDIVLESVPTVEKVSKKQVAKMMETQP